MQCSYFLNAIFVCVAESISRINILFSIIQNMLLLMLPHIFYEPYSSRSACYAGLCSLFKLSDLEVLTLYIWDIWSDQ